MSQSFDEAYRDFWNNRYKSEGYVYGTQPNEFFKEQLIKLAPGTILMPADGEARNGVFAAQMGWQVTSLDLSIEAKAKALELAKEKQVSLNYYVGDLEHLDFEGASFDAIGLIYAHFPADKKSSLHKKLDTFLKPGGTVIFEAYSKEHLRLVSINPKVGGPRDIDMLFSKEEILADFENYEVLMLEEMEVMLNEGVQHVGLGSVIRFIGRKREMTAAK
jgi:SAM-dependent methyltransferase